MPAQLRSAARVLLTALAGALAGYLLWKAYYTHGLLRPELVAFVAARKNVEFVGALISNMEASRHIFDAMPYVMLATPGALLLGIPVGVALRYTAHKRLLVYSMLAWPLGKYALSSFVLRVLKNLAEQEQVALWYSRGVGARDAFFIYSLFFTIVYLSYLLSARIRRHNP